MLFLLYFEGHLDYLNKILYSSFVIVDLSQRDLVLEMNMPYICLELKVLYRGPAPIEKKGRGSGDLSSHRDVPLWIHLGIQYTKEHGKTWRGSMMIASKTVKATRNF